MKKLRFWKEHIEEKLQEFLEELEGPKSLIEAMKYYPLQKGKRIRPLFTVAVADSLGGNIEDAITVGCAIELIHNYSLVHDDLPCMDDDDVRRGLPTCHVKFGEAHALLAGDAILTYAFEVLSNKKNFKTLTEGEILEIIKVIAKKSGANGMVGGQVLDIESYTDIYEISVKKTGALFEACFVCGGIVSKKQGVLKDLEKIGKNVGLLFQMVDDYLDKDGFYSIKGEALKYDIKRLHKELIEETERIFSKRDEILYLINLIYERING
ncbi:MAG: polyprenyl synthetase family protein [Aquifex sp.]|nr:MAG: polyprenyl synthetase family protein [Aquifex sp.]